MADSSSASNSSDPLFFICEKVSTSNTVAMVAAAVRIVLLLPLCTVVFYQSHRQRQQLSATASHADMFTYHMTAAQIIWFLSCLCFVWGKYANVQELKLLGFYLSLVDFYGETHFHVLTCVERYLAVVHPITYLKLKQARGIRIRNISIGCAWLLSLMLMGLTCLYHLKFPSMVFLCSLVFSLTVITFCSLSILCVLIRPGPGEGGANKERVDQSKQRAFYTVATITGLLCLWFVGYLVSILLEKLPQINSDVSCTMIAAVALFNLPCSLLLPLLYLHRARKLPCCC